MAKYTCSVSKNTSLSVHCQIHDFVYFSELCRYTLVLEKYDGSVNPQQVENFSVNVAVVLSNIELDNIDILMRTIPICILMESACTVC